MNLLRRLKRNNLDPLREWLNPDGEEMLAWHPLYLAMSEHYADDRDGPFEERAAFIAQKLREIARGERCLPDAVAERILEIDRQQQANGYPDANIAGLVALMQEGRG